MKQNKRYLFAGLFLSLVIIAISAYMFEKPHKEVDQLPADHTLTYIELFEAFSVDEAAANSQFLDKVVQVNGIVREINPLPDGTTNILFRSVSELNGVSCNLTSEQSNRAQVKVGDHLIVKGICTGILMDVVMVRCTLVNP